MRTFSFTI